MVGCFPSPGRAAEGPGSPWELRLRPECRDWMSQLKQFKSEQEGGLLDFPHVL